MTSILNEIIRKNKLNQLVKQMGATTWLADIASSNKLVLIKQYRKSDEKPHKLIQMYDSIFENSKSSSFVAYFHLVAFRNFHFILAEYCKDGDLNSYLIEFRCRSSEENAELQAIKWILQLLNAVEFLDNKSLVHTKISTYTVFVQNDNLKLDGFEFVKAVDPATKTVSIKDCERKGMFNSPESLGCILYEMLTCEWQNYRLLNESFQDWTPLKLPNSVSRDLKKAYKKMLRLSPKTRPNTQALYAILSDAHKYMTVRTKAGNERAFLMNFVDRFDKADKNDDEDEDLSDVEHEERHRLASFEDELEIETKIEKQKKFKSEKTEYRVMKVLEDMRHFSDYLVRNVQLKKRKFLREVRFRNNDEYQFTIREFQMLKKILNPSAIDGYTPYLAKYDDFFYSEKKMFCVGEYFEDGNLSRLIKNMIEQNRFFSEEKTFDFVYYLVDAVNYLHRKGILHRDIRPENIFLRNEKIKLGNLGMEPFLGIGFENLTHAKTPCYLSPELIETKNFTDKSDIWAIGCVMFELCVLRPAFLSENLFRKSQVKIPELNCASKLKSIFKALMRNFQDRPDSERLYNRLNDMIASEKSQIGKSF